MGAFTLCVDVLSVPWKEFGVAYTLLHGLSAWHLGGGIWTRFSSGWLLTAEPVLLLDLLDLGISHLVELSVIRMLLTQAVMGWVVP